MKREIDITMLMDNYTDNEFNIGGEPAVEADKVVSAVLPQVKQKKKVKPLFKVIAAAAAAVVLAGTTAATAFTIKGGYTTSTGAEVSYEFGENHGIWNISHGAEEVLRVEEGNRLMFVADGQYIDITDLVDENTPYIYSYENSNGDTCYIAAGGAAGDYGYVSMIPIPMSEDYVGWDENGYNVQVPREQRKEYPADIIVYDDDEMKEEKWEAYYKARDEAMRSWFKPWCLAAFEETGIWGSINGFGENVHPDWSVEFNESIGYVYPDE